MNGHVNNGAARVSTVQAIPDLFAISLELLTGQRVSAGPLRRNHPSVISSALAIYACAMSALLLDTTNPARTRGANSRDEKMLVTLKATVLAFGMRQEMLH